MSKKSHSSVPPPQKSMHSFEEARVFLPEEQKEYAVRRLHEIANLRTQLSTLADLEEIPEAFTREFGNLIASLEEPVFNDVFDQVREQSINRGSLNMGWDTVRKLYGVPNLTNLINLKLALQGHPTLSDIDAIDHELEQIAESLQQVIDERGGSSEDRLVEIISKYDIDRDSHWHYELFGSLEVQHYTMVLNDLSKRFGIPPHQLKTDDLGCGGGRCFHQMAELYVKGFDTNEGPTNSVHFPKHSPEELLEVAKNYHAVDKSHENVQHTRNLIRGILQNVNLEEEYAPYEHQVAVGDFHDPYDPNKDRPEPGSIHFALSMMRTTLHNITEDQLANFLKRVETNLVPGNEHRKGGVFLMDTATLVRILPDLRESEDAKAKLDDLKNLYTQLFRAYAERYQNLMPPGVNLMDMPRFPIYDNTTGQGFYWRESLTPEYVEYVINKYEIDLDLEMERKQWHDKTELMKNNTDERSRAVALGRKWITQNGLEDYYRKTIKERLDKGKISEETLEKTGEDIEGILDYLGYHMVKGFQSTYILLERPQKKD